MDWIPLRDRPFSQVEFERRRKVELLGRPLDLVSPEDLILAKLEWTARGGTDLHLRDALAILLQRGPELDRVYLERWIGRLGLERWWGILTEEEAEAERAEDEGR